MDLRKYAKPFQVLGVVGVIVLIPAAVLYAVGESGFEYGFDPAKGGGYFERYSTYNWGAIITLLVIGMVLLGVSAVLQRWKADWPEGFYRAAESIVPSPTRAPGVRAQRSRLLLSGPVPARRLHQQLLDGFMAAPEPRRDAAVYLLESVPGRVRVGFGVAGSDPLWQVEAHIDQAGPDRSTAIVSVTDARAEGQGLLAGEVLDAMFDHLEQVIPRVAPAVTVIRGAAAVG